MSPTEKTSTFGMWKLFSFIKNYWAQMGLAVGSGILNQIAAISASALGAYLTGMAVLGQGRDKIGVLLVVLASLIVARAVMYYLEMWFAHYVAYGVLADFRVLLFRALERIAPGHLINRRSGEVASALMADVELLEWFYAHTFGAFLVAIIVPVVVLLVMGFVHWFLPLILIPWIVLACTAPFWLRKKADQQGGLVRTYLAEVNAEIVDGIQGLREILSFGFESDYLKKLDESNKLLNRSQLDYGKRLGTEGGIVDAFVSLGMLCMLVTSAVLIGSGKLEPRWFPVVVILSIYVFAPVIGIAKMARNFGLIKAASTRVFSFLEMPPMVVDYSNFVPTSLEARIDFKNVDFQYGENLPQVLKRVSFSINKGETVALVGHSGVGKSTCANLLLRFWDTSGGAVEIGGYDIRDFTQHTLREMISYVPQDVYLFNMSVNENIRLGKPDASQEEIKRAAKEALAHEFILKLPEGYDTNIGERGSQLSGGQRQRIAIARALLKNAPILLMDEAVSNLDTQNERELQEILLKLRKGKTTLVIAHRLSTILSADRIIVLENGEVTEVGKHDELTKKGGAYYRLLGSQRDGIVA